MLVFSSFVLYCVKLPLLVINLSVSFWSSLYVILLGFILLWWWHHRYCGICLQVQPSSARPCDNWDVRRATKHRGGHIYVYILNVIHHDCLLCLLNTDLLPVTGVKNDAIKFWFRQHLITHVCVTGIRMLMMVWVDLTGSGQTCVSGPYIRQSHDPL